MARGNDAGSNRAQENNVAAIGTRDGDHGFYRSFRSNGPTDELAEFEDRVFQLKISHAADRAWVFENILKVVLKPDTAFLV